MRAIVTEVQPEYAVVDVAGAQGIIRISDLAWHWVDDATSEVQLGDDIEANVLEISVDSTELRLSRKVTLPNPLAGYRDDQLVGQEARLIVTRGARDSSNTASVFGRSAHVEPIPMRMYWEEYEWGGEPHALQRLGVGNELSVVIMKLDREAGYAICSHKRLAGDKWEIIRDKYPRGKELTLPVATVLSNGVLCDVETGLVGFVPEAEFRQAALEYADYRTRLHPGDTLYVYVSRAVGGARERLNLGLQRNRPNPVR